MGRTEPINPEEKGNIFLRIWLYPNVSSLKVVNAIPSLSDDHRQYATKGLSMILPIALEVFILYRGLHWINDENFQFIVIILSVIQGLPEFIYSKKIDQMSSSYFTYYSKPAFWGFVIFVIAGLCCAGLIFNDQIGHLKN